MSDSHRYETMTDDRLDALERWKDEMDERFASAFPEGDHRGHRAYHEMMIQEFKDRQEFRKAIIEKTVSGVVWSVLLGIAYACWEYVRAKLGVK